MMFMKIDSRRLNSAGVLRIAFAFLLATAWNGMAHSLEPDSSIQNGELAEIIVTGLKRNEKLIDLPVTAQVFTTDAIEKIGISRPQDFLALTSNVTFIQDNHAGEAFVNVRGQASIRQAESAVAVVIDGVQLATQNEFNGELFDVQQIEVLKGPQSALYGRNAAAGALIITTKPPTEELSGFVSGGYGNWNTEKLTAAVGGAIIPNQMHIRIAASESDSDGPFTNVISGENPYRSNEKVGRLRLDYEPTDDLKLDFRLGGSHVTGGAIAAHAQVVGATIDGYHVTAFNANTLWQIPFVSDVPGSDEQDKFSSSLKIDDNLGFATLTSVTAFSEIFDNYQGKNFPYADYSDPNTDFGVFAAAFGDKTQKYRITNKAITEEIRLTSTDSGPIRWMGGLYFLSSHKDFYSIQGINTSGAITPTLGINGPDAVNPTAQYDLTHYTARNIAPFANVQYDITRDLELSVAGRFDSEKRTAQAETPNIPNLVTGASTYNLCVLNTGLEPSECRGEKTFDQFQPKITLTYKMPDLGSIFASYGKGFKSGGFNPIGTRQTLLNAYIAAGQNPNTVFVQDTYGKETSDAYELGFKSEWFERRLNVNGAIFYTNVHGAQEFEFNPIAGIQAVSSIDKTRVKGAEIEANYQIVDGFTIYGSYGYIDSVIVALAAAPQFVGNRTPYSAHYTSEIGTQYVAEISQRFNFTTRFDYTNSGTMWFNAENSPGTEREPVGLANARVAISSNRWEVALWSKNLFNKKYTEEIVPLVDNLLQAGFPGLTRSYGVEGKVNF